MKIDFEKVKEFAFKTHDNPISGQRYGNLPYSVHLEDVLLNIEKYIYFIPIEKRNVVRCAAVCHDVPEDHPEISLKELAKMLGDEAADIVFRVTNERGVDRKERNFKTYPKIWVNDLAIFVKLCDRISNTKNSKNTGHSLYKTYKEEYSVFKYALKVRNLYPEMWKELDELYDSH